MRPYKECRKEIQKKIAQKEAHTKEITNLLSKVTERKFTKTDMAQLSQWENDDKTLSSFIRQQVITIVVPVAERDAEAEYNNVSRAGKITNTLEKYALFSKENIGY